MRFIILSLVLLSSFAALQAQKLNIDSSTYTIWPVLGNVGISNNGRFSFHFIFNKPTGSNSLVVSSNFDNWNIIFPNIPSQPCGFTKDSRKIVISLPNDSLAILDLEKRIVKYLSDVKSYQVAKLKDADWLIYELNSAAQQYVFVNLQSGKSFVRNGLLNCFINISANSVIIEKAKDSVHSLTWLDLETNANKEIWTSLNISPQSLSFDKSGKSCSFFTSVDSDGNAHFKIWYYNVSNNSADIVASDQYDDLKNYSITNDLNFNRRGNCIYVKLKKITLNNSDKSINSDVNIWNYKDKYDQTLQLRQNDFAEPVVCCINLESHKIFKLNDDNEKAILSEENDNDSYVLIYQNPLPDNYYTKEDRPSIFLESVKDGKRTLLLRNYNFSGFRTMGPQLSPGEKFVVWFDIDSLVWYCYEIATGAIINLSHLVPIELYDAEALKVGRRAAFGQPIWLSNDSRLLIYDKYDIWSIDPKGKKPAFNITSSIGLSNCIVFNIIPPIYGDIRNAITMASKYILSGFNTKTKESGFWALDQKFRSGPIKLSMESNASSVTRPSLIGYNAPANTERPAKALKADVYLVKKMRADQSLNLAVTKDFKSFSYISSIYPEKEYNWLKSELITWKVDDRQVSQGVLYKPENFDPSKKYPIIFEYYEKMSDGLHKYMNPDYSADRINIPTYVSNGYLVFTPDIYYCSEKNGESVFKSIISAAKYLSSFPWIDSSRMGIQGHSFGGWETNYLVTHSHLFAAACEASGISDLVSSYGEFEFETGQSFHELYEVTGQGSAYGIGVTPWTSPKAYIENSPIFYIDSITTPLLMMQTERDKDVPFPQAIELYTAMKRAGKKVWLLDYKYSDHSTEKNEAKDYSYRMQQFFDYYLKQASPPTWMTKGVPANRRLIDRGLELDKSGEQP